jgi:cell division protein FtsN
MFQYHQIPPGRDFKAGKSGKNLKGLPAAMLLAAAMALLFQIGCSSAKKSGQAARPKDKQEAGRSTAESSTLGATVMNEDFDPMTLKASEFRLERKFQPAAESLSTAAGGRKSDTLAVTTAPVDTSWHTAPGYRVQLLQTQDTKLARATVREAILALNTEVEIIYEAPYYKVRAGQFTNRYDAEQLQNLASDKGYANCWVVRTQVKVRASDLLNQK